MTDTVIRVEGVGKRYQLGERQPYKTLGDAFGRALSAATTHFGRSDSPDGQHRGLRHGSGQIWALRDVSFEVRRGERVGILGANGSGKSTLLKILCRIVRPTTGRTEVVGRPGALLEVGTGFHPELTGRENIFFNGVIIGLTRAEIARKFDEIVDFAGVDAFLDTPLKHYSSGMQVRLAFSVASQLEADVLLVDEVLAVGDAAFQQKSIARMKQATLDGRTVLFVSHNLAAIRELCTRGILLRDGRVCADGPVAAAIDKYAQQAGRDPASPDLGGSGVG